MKVDNFNLIKRNMGDKWSSDTNFLSDDYGPILIGWDSNSFLVRKIKENRQLVRVKVIEDSK